MNGRNAAQASGGKRPAAICWFGAAGLLAVIGAFALFRPIDGAPREGEGRALEAEVFSARMQDSFEERRLFAGTLSASG
jgi:hypothetical protein